MDGVDWRPGSYPDLRRVDVLGVGVSPVDMEPALGSFGVGFVAERRTPCAHCPHTAPDPVKDVPLVVVFSMAAALRGKTGGPCFN